MSNTQSLISILEAKAVEADRYECDDDDRYDEGYADALYTALDLLKEALG